MTALQVGDRVKVGLKALESSVAREHYGKRGNVISLSTKEVTYPYNVSLDDGTIEAFTSEELLPI